MATSRSIWPSPADDRLPTLAVGEGERFDDLARAELDGLLRRIGDAEVVLIGEASHGTSEFYRMRERITRALIERKGFRIVAVEADWPDAAHVDRYVRHLEDGSAAAEGPAFARFPSWMWRNLEVATFVDWLHEYNRDQPARERTGFHGLDIYSLYRSIASVLKYLQHTDGELATRMRKRYACLDPWFERPAEYGYAAVSGTSDDCERAVVANLRELLQADVGSADGALWLDAVQNARVVANAERYYRIMYSGSRESWNLRDSHMFETLETLREARGGARAVVWAHNSHVGDARATQMGDLGEHNIGSLSRERWGASAWLIGFGTDHGTVAAASDWDGRREIKRVRPARDDSYEGALHQTGTPGLLLPIRHGSDELRRCLSERRLERAIGVIYRPETERASHYFDADLSRQFDEFIWIDETHAVTELEGPHLEGMPDTWPFGL